MSTVDFNQMGEYHIRVSYHHDETNVMFRLEQEPIGWIIAVASDQTVHYEKPFRADALLTVWLSEQYQTGVELWRGTQAPIGVWAMLVSNVLFYHAAREKLEAEKGVGDVGIDDIW